MPAPDLASLVAAFLPLDPKAAEAAYSHGIEAPAVAASTAALTTAAQHSVRRADRLELRSFCRRVAAGDADVQAWMVEAVVRSLGHDRNAISGIDPGVVLSIHLLALGVLCSEYLTVAECEDLRPEATALARDLLPHLEALTGKGAAPAAGTDHAR